MTKNKDKQKASAQVRDEVVNDHPTSEAPVLDSEASFAALEAIWGSHAILRLVRVAHRTLDEDLTPEDRETLIFHLLDSLTCIEVEEAEESLRIIEEGLVPLLNPDHQAQWVLKQSLSRLMRGEMRVEVTKTTLTDKGDAS